MAGMAGMGANRAEALTACRQASGIDPRPFDRRTEVGAGLCRGVGGLSGGSARRDGQGDLFDMARSLNLTGHLAIDLTSHLHE